MSYYPAQLRRIHDYCSGLNSIEKNTDMASTGITIEASLPVLDCGKFIGRLVRTDKGWAFEPFKTDFDEKVSQYAYDALGGDPGRIVDITINQAIGEPTRVDASFVKPGPICQRT